MPTSRRALLKTAAALPLLGTARARAAGRAPGHLVFGLSAWPATLAPWVNAGTVAQNVKLLLFRGLLGYAADGRMQGDLAESWAREDDGTWVFHLRQALFHNGDPVTSEDVRYSIEQMAGEKSTAYLRGDMQRIVKIQTPDARTVRLTTKEPTVVLPNLFASPSAFIVAKGSADNNGPGIGAGPFMLAGQERGTYVDLVAFDRYYVPGLPKLKTIRMVAYADENARVAALHAGDVDLIEYVPWSEMTAIKDNPALALQTTEGPFMLIYFNAKSGPFSDARVRRAAALAIRRDEVVKGVFFGRGVVLEGLPIERTSPYYDETLSHGWAYDPAQAKALMAAAGCATGFDCKFLSTATYGFVKNTSEVLQSQLAEIGIRAELVLPDWATRITMGNRGQYDLTVNGTTNESSDPDGMSNIVGTDLPVSYTRSYGLSLPRVDALLAEGRRTFDPARRKAVYDELQKLCLEQVPLATLCWRDQGYAMAHDVRGFTNMPGALTFYSARTLETTEFA
jgi:peptide/nickel transport system substrate-binding protein